MVSPEPIPTAMMVLAAGLLAAAAVMVSKVARRFGVPVMLLFLALGMLAGSDGIGGIHFEDYTLTFRVGTVALVLILFDGGLNTPRSTVEQALAPAAILATVGVVGTAALVAVGAWLLGVPWPEATLLGAVVSSTDAAAVFLVLRGGGLHLRRRVASTLELESGSNDPMAVILTLTVTQALIEDQPPGLSAALDVARQIAVGGGLGLAIGVGARRLLAVARLPAGGLYPVLTLAIALLAFAIPTLLGGSGFLAVYLAGLVLGNGALPYRAGLLRVHDGIAWTSQVAMFLLLGLLVFPSRLPAIAPLGFAIALFLAFIARPLAVMLCLAPFRYPLRESVFIGWMGLRGAVPIVLATFPVLAGAPGATTMFDVVFFVVVLNTLLQGGTTRWLTRRLGLEADEPPPPAASVEINSTQVVEGELVSFYLGPRSRAAGRSLRELAFPAGAAAMLIVRGRELIAPKGSTVLAQGDHVHVFFRPRDRAVIDAIFAERT